MCDVKLIILCSFSFLGCSTLVPHSRSKATLCGENIIHVRSHLPTVTTGRTHLTKNMGGTRLGMNLWEGSNTSCFWFGAGPGAIEWYCLLDILFTDNTNCPVLPKLDCEWIGPSIDLSRLESRNLQTTMSWPGPEDVKATAAICMHACTYIRMYVYMHVCIVLKCAALYPTKYMYVRMYG